MQDFSPLGELVLWTVYYLMMATPHIASYSLTFALLGNRWYALGGGLLLALWVNLAQWERMGPELLPGIPIGLAISWLLSFLGGKMPGTKRPTPLARAFSGVIGAVSAIAALRFFH